MNFHQFSWEIQSEAVFCSSFKGGHARVPVCLRSDQGPVSEPCLLGTNVVLPIRLMVPLQSKKIMESSRPSVETKEVGQGEVAIVWLIKFERVLEVVVELWWKKLKYRGVVVLLWWSQKEC